MCDVCWFGSDRGHKTFLVYSLEYKGTTGVAVVRCITPLTVVGLCVYPVDYTKRRNHRIVTQSLKDRSGVAKDIIPKPFRPSEWPFRCPFRRSDGAAHRNDAGTTD